MNVQSQRWTGALNEAVLFYGLKTPYHAGKRRVVDTLTKMLRLQGYCQGKTFTVQRQGVWWALNPACLIQRSLYYLSVFEEPLASNFHLLTRNKTLNAFDGVVPVKLALSDQAGEVDFFVLPLKLLGRGPHRRWQGGRSRRVRRQGAGDDAR